MKLSVSVLLIAQIIATVNCTSAKSSPACKNQDGKDVDWFIVYKLPQMQDNKGFKSDGGRFAYVDARSANGGLKYWPLSHQDLYKDGNPVARTLAPLFEKTARKDILYFAYNDQPPPEYKGTRNGHTKGVVLFDNTRGVWLLHSVPKFVGGLHGGQYKFPESAKGNGQLFMCVTFPTTQLDKIAAILRTEYAKVYAHNKPDWVTKQRYPEVVDLADESFVRNRDELKVDLTSSGGVALKAYAKRATTGEDLYLGVLAKDLGGAIAVQSWRNEPGGKLPNMRKPNCVVVNVDGLVMRFDKNIAVNINTSKDHSKWAVTVDKDVFCFASMNRMESQEKRGGEALCFSNPAVKALFRRSAVISEQCPVEEPERKKPRKEPSQKKPSPQSKPSKRGRA